MRFVIIGGDAAGMSAASRAKRNQPDMEVIVLEQTADVSYSACGMPYNIAEPDREMDDLVVRHAHVFREKQGIDLRTGHRAESIDPGSKTVSGRAVKGDPFQLTYDKLLIATGASPIIPHLPGFDQDGVFGLKSLEDGRRIKQYIAEHQVKKVVIIGMGYIALEMAEALRSRDIDVAMVKPRPVFLPWMNESLSAMVREEIERHDARMYPGHEVKAIEKAADGLRVICGDLELDAQMVVVAAAPLDSDFGRETWTQLHDGPVLKPELPWEKRCIEAPTLVERNGTLYMFYAGAYNNEPQQIGVALSEDGIHFRRMSDKPLLPNGGPDEWNASESGHPGAFVDDDGQMYLFFQGNRTNGKDWYLSKMRIEWEGDKPYLVRPRDGTQFHVR